MAANLLKVVLLNVGPPPGRRVFYAEPSEDLAEDAAESNDPPARGLRGWVRAKLARLREGWRRSQGRGARLGRRAWEWLQRRAHPDEPLLARLRKAGAVEVYHPASMTIGEAAAAWSEFLDRAGRRHLPWFLVNALVSPLTVVLAALPGPNVIGYWFAYRALCHGVILSGLRKARSGRLKTTFRPVEGLKAGGTDPGCLAALGCDPSAVANYLERHGLRPPFVFRGAVGYHRGAVPGDPAGGGAATGCPTHATAQLQHP